MLKKNPSVALACGSTCFIPISSTFPVCVMFREQMFHWMSVNLSLSYKKGISYYTHIIWRHPNMFKWLSAFIAVPWEKATLVVCSYNKPDVLPCYIPRAGRRPTAATATISGTLAWNDNECALCACMCAALPPGFICCVQ